MMRIELLGTSFQIQSDESPDHVQQLLDHYKERIHEVESSVATGDPLKKAILAALLVTDELFRERKRGDRRTNDGIPPDQVQEIERITTSLIARLESSLQ